MWAFALSPNGGQLWVLVTDCEDTSKLTAHAYELPKLTEDEYFFLYHNAQMNERVHLRAN
jgi:hypothetical protein